MTKNTVSQLRVLDAEILRHVIDRGKLWDKRKRLLACLAKSDPEELSAYQVELQEWLHEMATESKGGK